MATQHFLQRLQRPPSPTLTNPDLILPDHGSAARLQTDVPAFRQRPPSPSQILRKVNSNSPFDAAPAYAHAHSNSRAHSHRSAASIVAASSAASSSSATRTPPLSRRSSNLDEHDELDATPRRPTTGLQNGIASSPILSDSQSHRLHPRSGAGAGSNILAGPADDSKRWSIASSSVHSEDFESLESLKWPGFDSGADVDGDDGIELIDEDEDEEEQFGSFPDTSSGVHARNSSESRRKFGGVDLEDDDDDDPYSPNALSRRADMILANAKKRLTLFEGNLNSARHSLPVAQSMSMASLRAPPDMPSLPTPPRENINYAGLAGPIDSSNSGHSRGFSEASASSFIQQLLVARKQRKTMPNAQPGQRSVSALATHTQQSNHVRSSKSQELMREHRIQSWVFGDAQESLASPTVSLSEDPAGRESIRRSPSTTNDLRAQMNELKGKISSLQQRAKDENLRRRSYASVRSQSAASFRNGGSGSPLANEITRNHSSLNGASAANAARRPDHGAANGYAVMPGAYVDSQYGDDDDEYDEDDDVELNEIDNESPEARAMLHETLSELEEQGADDASVYESVFGDDGADPAVRHEDRHDAFDYENFFLHSAMGSYTRDHSGSVSSEDSAETTKPIAPRAAANGVASAQNDEDAEVDEYDEDEDESEGRTEEPEKDQSDEQSLLHKRHLSTESISTLATFTTATEGESDGDEDLNDNPALDDALAGMTPLPQVAGPAATLNQRDTGVATPAREGATAVLQNGVKAAVGDREVVPIAAAKPMTNGIKSVDHHARASAETINPALLASLTAVGAKEDLGHLGVLFSPTGVSIAGKPVPLDAEDHVLVRSVAMSLERICFALQHKGGEADNIALLKKRLEEAKRVLDGAEAKAAVAELAKATATAVDE